MFVNNINMSKIITFTLFLAVASGATVASVASMSLNKEPILENIPIEISSSIESSVSSLQSSVSSLESSSSSISSMSSSKQTEKVPKTNSSAPEKTTTQPKVTEPVTSAISSITPKYVYRTELLAGAGVNNGMAKDKIARCEYKCTYTIVEMDKTGNYVKSFYMDFENEQELIKLFSYKVKYTKVAV